MDGGNSLVEKAKQWPVEIKDYLQDLQTEMRKVTWPSRKQVESTTAVVVVTVFAFAAYFAVIDSVIAQLIAKIFTIAAKH